MQAEEKQDLSCAVVLAHGAAKPAVGKGAGNAKSERWTLLWLDLTKRRLDANSHVNNRRGKASACPGRPLRGLDSPKGVLFPHLPVWAITTALACVRVQVLAPSGCV